MQEFDPFYASEEHRAIVQTIVRFPVTPDGFTSKTRKSIESRISLGVGELIGDRAILLVWDFLKKVEKTKTIQSGLTSYQLKHWLEEAKTTYVSNGAFIVGAILAGCEVEPIGKNARFNISRKSFIQNL